MQRETYVLIAEDGDASEEIDRLEDARTAARRDSVRQAVVRRVYEYSHEEVVDWPEDADAWPPSEEAQDIYGQRFVR